MKELPDTDSRLDRARRNDGLPVLPWEIVVPEFQPSKKVKTPTLEAFLKQVVRVRGEAEATRRLRQFLKSQCPEGKDKEDFAADTFASLKESDLTHAKWDKLGRDYGAWWMNDKSATNKQNRQGR